MLIGMSKMRKLRFVVIYVIFLIVSLPIYSSVVFGIYADTPVASGNDNLPDFRRNTDVLHVTITNIDFQNGYTQISKEYLLLWPSSSSPVAFTDCSDSVPATCNFVATQSNTYYPHKETGWYVKFYNDTERNNYIGQSDTFDFYIDGNPPTITLQTPQGTTSGLKVPYKVEESSGGDASTLCSGIKEITIKGEVKDSGSLVELNKTIIDVACTSNTYEHDKLSGQIISNDILKSSLGLGNKVYDLTICIEASDRLGQMPDESVCGDITGYDLKAPVIDDNSFSITKDGVSIDNSNVYIKEDDDIVITIDVDEDSGVIAIGNFSVINVDQGGNAVTCTGSDSTKTCTWNINVLGATSGSGTISITATDSFGNSDMFPKTISIKVDNDAPVVDSIKSDKVFPEIDGISYVKENNNVMIALINETGSGFSTEKPLLNNVPPDTCIINSEALWQCTWNDINFTGMDDSMLEIISFELTGTDDVGNGFDNSQCTTACYLTTDTTPPSVTNIDINNGETISVGDDLRINVTFTETGSGFAGTSATFANTTGNCNLNKAADSCSAETTGDLWCYWTGNVVDNTCMTEEINFIIEDRVGNKQSYPTSLSDAQAPNVINLTSFGDWIGPLNTFIAEINETGSGIDKANVKLTGLGLNQKEADHCSPVTGIVSCYWENVSCDNCGNTETLKLNVTDNAGNAAEPYTKTFNVDVEPATVEEDVFIQDIGSLRTQDDYIQSGDILDIKVKASDEKSTTMSALLNASEIGIVGELTGTCTNISSLSETPKQFECSWNGHDQNIDIPDDLSGLDKKLRFKFIDHAGNVNYYNHSIDVLIPAEAEEFMYTVNVEDPSPVEKLSRRILATTGNVPIFFPVNFIKKELNQQTTIFRKTASCSSALGFVQESRLMLERSSLEQDNLKLLIGGPGEEPISETELQMDAFDIDCTITIKFAEEGKSIIYTETHNKSVKVPLYRSPIDDAPKLVLEKINKSKDAIFATWDWLAKADQVLKTAQNLCLSFGAYTRVYNTIEYLKIPVYAASQTLSLPGLWESYVKVAQLGEKLKNLFWSPWDFGLDKFVEIEGTGGIFDRALGGKEGGGSVGIFRRMCSFASCAQCFDPEYEGVWFSELRDATENWMPGAYEKLNKFIEEDVGYVEEERGGVVRGPFEILGDLTDPKKVTPYLYLSLSPDRSFITAASCLCLPAMMAHIQRYRGINCEYIRCVKDSAISIYNMEGCDIAREWNMCLYFAGSVFSFFPITDALERLSDVIVSLINQAPARAITMMRGTLCESLDVVNPLKQTTLDAIKIPPIQYISCGILDAYLLGISYNDQGNLDWSWKTYGESVFGNLRDYFKWNLPWKSAELQDPCNGIYCEKDKDCNNGEKCYDGVCYDLGIAE